MEKLLFAVLAIFLTFKFCSSRGSDNVEKSKNPIHVVTPKSSSPNPINYYNSTDNSTNSAVEKRFNASSAEDNVYTDPEYKYEYRTGTSGNYQYNYDINGSDEYGNDVYGNVDMDGKYGSGIVEDSEGNEIDVDVEWIDYGILEATDEDGNTYELYVDE